MTIELQHKRWERETVLALYDLERDGVCPSTEQDLGAHLGYRYLEEFERDAPEIEHAVRTLERFGLLDLDDQGMRLTIPGHAMAMRLRGQPSPDRHMKAVRIHAYGGPERLLCEEVPRPEPAEGEALVRIYAASVDPADIAARQGAPFPLPFTPGWGFSGVVEAVGPSVTAVGAGTPVYGMLAFHHAGGAQAEYLVAPATSLLPKPESLDHVQAAAVPVAGLTTWQALYDLADLWRGQTVLVRDAASGVGTFAVQLACCVGARVIATAQPENLDFVHSLGADEAFTREDLPVEAFAHGVDVVLDSSSQDSRGALESVLRRGGSYVRAGSTSGSHSRTVIDGIIVVTVVPEPNRAELARIGELINQGKVRPIVGMVLSLPDIQQAHRHLQSGHTRGQIVLRVRG